MLRIVNAEFNYNRCDKYAAKVDLVELEIGDADAGGFAAFGKGSVGCLDEKTGDRRFNLMMVCGGGRNLLGIQPASSLEVLVVCCICEDYNYIHPNHELSSHFRIC